MDAAARPLYKVAAPRRAHGPPRPDLLPLLPGQRARSAVGPLPDDRRRVPDPAGVLLSAPGPPRGLPVRLAEGARAARVPGGLRLGRPGTARGGTSALASPGGHRLRAVPRPVAP